MKKIDPSLQREIKANPLKKFEVIITLNENFSIESLNIKDYKMLMENILLATLNGKEISDLAKNKDVVSIEKDIEVSVS